MGESTVVRKTGRKTSGCLGRPLRRSLTGILGILIFLLATNCATRRDQRQPSWFSVTSVSISGPNRILEGSSETYDVRFTIRRSGGALDVTPKVYLLDRDSGLRGGDDWLSEGEGRVAADEESGRTVFTLRCQDNTVRGTGTRFGADSRSGEGGGILGDPAEIYARVGEAVSNIIQVTCGSP